MMWECKLGTQKPCLRLTASRSTGLARWEHVHRTLYGLQPSCPLPSGTSCVTLLRDNASPKSVQEEHKEKVNFLPDIPSEPTCPLLPLALWSLSLLRRPFVKRIRSRLPRRTNKVLGLGPPRPLFQVQHSVQPVNSSLFPEHITLFLGSMFSLCTCCSPGWDVPSSLPPKGDTYSSMEPSMISQAEMMLPSTL